MVLHVARRCARAVKCVVRGRFFFHAEDGIRGRNVTGVQTCALPIFAPLMPGINDSPKQVEAILQACADAKIGRASCRERVETGAAAGRRKKEGGRTRYLGRDVYPYKRTGSGSCTARSATAESGNWSR